MTSSPSSQTCFSPRTTAWLEVSRPKLKWRRCRGASASSGWGGSSARTSRVKRVSSVSSVLDAVRRTSNKVEGHKMGPAPAAVDSAPAYSVDPANKAVYNMLSWQAAVLFAGFVLITLLWEFGTALLAFVTIYFSGRRAIWLQRLKVRDDPSNGPCQVAD